MQQFYKLPLVLDPQPEGGWTITCPVLPELVTEADTWEEINPKVTDALGSVLEIIRSTGMPMPDVLTPIDQSEPIFLNAAIPVRSRA